VEQKNRGFRAPRICSVEMDSDANRPAAARLQARGDLAEGAAEIGADCPHNCGGSDAN